MLAPLIAIREGCESSSFPIPKFLTILFDQSYSVKIKGARRIKGCVFSE